MKRIKFWFKAWVVKKMFTPVRAHKLVRAQLDVDKVVSTVSLSITKADFRPWAYSSLVVHYRNSPADVRWFHYERGEDDLAMSEYLFIRSLVEAQGK